LAPGVYGDLTIASGNIVHLSAGTYDLNSIKLTGNAEIVVDSGPVILSVAGTGQTTPVDLTGGTLTNSSLVASNFQIVYGGTGTIKVNGGSASSGVIYAPNAAVIFNGGSDWYGAAIGATVSVSGGMGLHYDTQLGGTAYAYGNYMLDSFSWKKF